VLPGNVKRSDQLLMAKPQVAGSHSGSHGLRGGSALLLASMIIRAFAVLNTCLISSWWRAGELAR